MKGGHEARHGRIAAPASQMACTELTASEVGVPNQMAKVPGGHLVRPRGSEMVYKDVRCTQEILFCLNYLDFIKRLSIFTYIYVYIYTPYLYVCICILYFFNRIALKNLLKNKSPS